MIIAINTRYPAGDIPNGYHEFLSACFSYLARKYPQHRFVFIGGPAFAGIFHPTENLHLEPAGPDHISPLLRTYWYNYKLPALLRKLKADIYFSADGTAVFRTRVKQYCLAGSMGWAEQPAYHPKGLASIYKKHLPMAFAKASQLMAFSAADAEICRALPGSTEKKFCLVPPPSLNGPDPVEHDKREQILEELTGGREYFLYCGPGGKAANGINLLKAFSFFKKRQKSNMQLVMALQGKEQDPAFNAAFPSFRFRNEVIRIQDPSADELKNLFAAAYALILPGYSNSPYVNHAAAAMQCGVPVICTDIPAHREWFGEAALYTDPGNINDMAQQLMWLYKDEEKRKELIAASGAIAGRFAMKECADTIWNAIEEKVPR